MPTHTWMDENLHILSDAMVLKERLQLLAEIQASYLHALSEQGMDQALAEQLLVDWSRHAFTMTMTPPSQFQPPSLDEQIDELLGIGCEAGASSPAPASPGASGDPSRVPPGEPWLQLVQDEDAAHDDGDATDADDVRDAA